MSAALRGGAVHPTAHHLGLTMQINEDPADFSTLDDAALLSRRAELRAQLASLSPQSPEHVRLTFLCDVSTAEVQTRGFFCGGGRRSAVPYRRRLETVTQ